MQFRGEYCSWQLMALFKSSGFFYINHERFQRYKLSIEISTESLLTEILPAIESLSRQNLISFLLICCICFIQYIQYDNYFSAFLMENW